MRCFRGFSWSCLWSQQFDLSTKQLSPKRMMLNFLNTLCLRVCSCISYTFDRNPSTFFTLTQGVDKVFRDFLSSRFQRFTTISQKRQMISICREQKIQQFSSSSHYTHRSFFGLPFWLVFWFFLLVLLLLTQLSSPFSLEFLP